MAHTSFRIGNSLRFKKGDSFQCRSKFCKHKGHRRVLKRGSRKAPKCPYCYRIMQYE